MEGCVEGYRAWWGKGGGTEGEEGQAVGGSRAVNGHANVVGSVSRYLKDDMQYRDCVCDGDMRQRVAAGA